MPSHPKTIKLSGFKGINNVERPENTASNYLKKAVNIDISKTDAVSKRLGYSKIINSENSHSLWSDGERCFYINSGRLKEISKSLDVVDLGFIGDVLTDFLSLNGIIYYVNPITTGIIENNTHRSFGITPPSRAPDVREGAGSLNAGTYQIAVSFVDDAGRESGLSKIVTLSVNDGGSIVLDNIPKLSNHLTRIYCSTQDGTTLYLHSDTNKNSFVIYNQRDLITSSDNFGITSAPVGSLIEYYLGRILISSENILYYSEPLSYEWWRPSSNFHQFSSNITMIMPLESGIYIGTENELFWLAGDIHTSKAVNKEMLKPIRGSNTKIPSGYIRIENTPLGSKWLFSSNEGIFVGMENGVVFNVTSSNVALPIANESASLFMQNNGINKYISLLKNENDDDQNFAVGDLASAEVIRNGILI